jgi:translation initiation factor IF-2
LVFLGLLTILKLYANIDTGSLASLKNVKKDVQEMKKGSECGMGFEGWFDFQIGDQIQSYEERSEKRYL